MEVEFNWPEPPEEDRPQTVSTNGPQEDIKVLRPSDVMSFPDPTVLTAKDTITIDQVKQKFSELLTLKDPYVVDVVLGIVVANQYRADPVNLYLIGPPSSAKTEILLSVKDYRRCYLLSSLTSQSFISGLTIPRPNQAANSFLLRLTEMGRNILIFKDFTTVLEMRQESRSEIISQMREISDGHFSRAFGTGQTIPWEGKLAFLFGVTPMIDKHYSIHAQLGERFLNYRLDSGDDAEGEKQSMKALEATGEEKTIREKLRKFVTDFLDQFSPDTDIQSMALDEGMKLKLHYLAEFVAKGRTGVARDRYTHNLEYIPEPERTPRLIKQLRVLGAGIAAIHRKTTLDDQIYKILKKVAQDSLPRQRNLILRDMWNGGWYGFDTSWVSTTDLSSLTNIPKESLRSYLKDLLLLRVVEQYKVGGSSGDYWKLGQRCEELIKNSMIYAD